MTKLVQIQRGVARGVALVEENNLRLLTGIASVYELAASADANKTSLLKDIRDRAMGLCLDYEAIYSGKSDWKLMAPIDHPIEPSRVTRYV